MNGPDPARPGFDPAAQNPAPFPGSWQQAGVRPATESAPDIASAPPIRAALTPGDPGDELAERPHPLSPLVKGWIAVAALLFFVLRDLPGRDLSSVLRIWWVIPIGILLAFLVPLVGGYFNWRFTRFVIDDEQVRIERRFISHRSDRIAFTKIQSVDVNQPLVARLLGLAALHIDVGSAGSGRSIEFLRRERAYQLRDYLIARAQGTATTVGSSARRPVGDAFHDAGGTDRIVVRVPNQRLIASILVSSLTVWFLVIAAAMVIATLVIDQPEALFSGIAVLPLAIALVSSVASRLRNEFNHTLTAAGSGGLRITRGLTSLVSQTIPLDRIQGIDITRPLLWRPFGWHRVRLDVLGLGTPGDGADKSNSSLLLPVGTREEVSAVLAAVWPQLDLAAMPMHHIPARARRVRWFDAHTWRWGHDDEALVASGGLLSPRTSIVPHARVQSVRLVQGPVQRLIGLASVQAHTTPGPVDLVCRHLDAAQARLLALEELDRMRAARARIRPALEAGHPSGNFGGPNPARPDARANRPG